MTKVILFNFTLLFTVHSFGQCNNQVTHLSGTSVVNDVQVTATPNGMTEFNDVFCDETFPYVIGFNLINGNGDGAYTFDFDPPIDQLRLNFSGISSLSGSSERLSLSVNGSHYPIPEVGDLNTCGPLAILTPSGDIEACTSCNTSGWSNTTISGSISSLTVAQTVLTGNPNGSIFSLFICDPVLGALDQEPNSAVVLYPNPMNELSTLSSDKIMDNITVGIYSITGQLLRIQHIKGSDTVQIQKNELLSGVYFVQLSKAGKTLTTKKLVIQ